MKRTKIKNKIIEKKTPYASRTCPLLLFLALEYLFRSLTRGFLSSFFFRTANKKEKMTIFQCKDFPKVKDQTSYPFVFLNCVVNSSFLITEIYTKNILFCHRLILSSSFSWPKKNIIWKERLL